MKLHRLAMRMFQQRALPVRAADGRFISNERQRIRERSRLMRAELGLDPDPRLENREIKA